MGKVTTGFSMSLDGFIAGPHDSPQNPLGDGGERLFKWYTTNAEDEVPLGEGRMKMSREGAEMVQEASRGAGVLVTARRTFDIANAWGGRHPMDVPIVVVTHTVPPEWANRESIFTFVTDGVESAIQQAKKTAGDRSVAVGAPSAAQQALKAGLIDEIQIDLVPVLLGRGIRLFDHLGDTPIELESTSISAGTGVIHLGFRVVK